MRSKLKLASGIAVAATLFVAVTATQGSGALAEDMAGTIVVPAPVRFVSEPVVQQVPVSDQETAATADSAPVKGEAEPVTGKAARQTVDARSLAQLIASQPQPQTLSPELNCLAGAIYFEARGESLNGQLAVGRVVVERARSGRFPASYCGVVLQRSQFSFVTGGRIPAPRTGSKAWRNAVAIAQIAHDGSWQSPAEGALFFHATHVAPQWRLRRIGRVDNHVFYR